MTLTTGQVLEFGSCRREGDVLQCRRSGGLVGIPVELVARIEPAEAPDRPARRQPARRERSAAPARRPSEEPPPSPDSVPGFAATLSDADARERIDDLTATLARPGVDEASTRGAIAALLAYRGNLAMISGNYEEADALFLSALEHEPTLSVARLNRAAALITLDRHQAAEEILLQMISQNPEDARALELMGISEFQTGHLEEAIELWERSLELQPRDALAARLERARRLKGAEEGFLRSDAAHFALKFDGGEASPDLAAEILDALESGWAELAARFAHYPESVAQVVLYSRRSFHEATESPSWVGGLFDGQIRVPIGGIQRLNPRVVGVLRHELAHYFVASKSRGSAPEWLQEGIAQVVEGRSGARLKVGLLEAHRALGEAGLSEFSYPKSLSQMEFFLETWTGSHLNDLLDHLGRGTDIDAAMKQVTGLDHGQFLTAWADWLER